jgi:hypothetical protein
VHHVRSLAVWVWLVAGCALDRTLSEVPPNRCERCGPEPIGITNRDLDVLFVIDNSPAMTDKQRNLTNSFLNFLDVLATADDGLPNLHLGVVSSDLGTKGALDAQPGPAIGTGPGACSGNGLAGVLQTNGTTLVTGPYISDVMASDGTRTTNYVGSLASAFAAIATVGSDGCGFEQHLEAAKRALNNNPSNAGFMRPDALLALVFVQDEDDCSLAHSSLLDVDTSVLGPLQSFRCNRFGHTCAQGGATPDDMNAVGPKSGCSSNEASAYLTHVADYVSFFKGLKDDPMQVIVAGIAGPPSPYEVELRVPDGGTTAIPAVTHACTYAGATAPEVADPAVRLGQFLGQFPNRNTFSTVCAQDLSGALTQAAQLITTVMGSMCVDRPIDLDNSTPGPQVDCTVSEVVNYGRANQLETVLPSCIDPPDALNKPCWWLLEDAARCPRYDHLRLRVERTQPAERGSQLLMYCATSAP